MADIGVHGKNRKNIDHKVKAESKNMHRFKSYAQNKIDSEILAITIVLYYNLARKRLIQTT